METIKLNQRGKTHIDRANNCPPSKITVIICCVFLYPYNDNRLINNQYPENSKLDILVSITVSFYYQNCGTAVVSLSENLIKIQLNNEVTRQLETTMSDEYTIFFLLFSQVKVEERMLLQFHYTQWHSHTTPFSNAILEFRRRVRSVVGNIIKPNSRMGPLLVHCK